METKNEYKNIEINRNKWSINPVNQTPVTSPSFPFLQGGEEGAQGQDVAHARGLRPWLSGGPLISALARKVMMLRLRK